ncbi:Dabb family protein [Streptomyces sp. CT34]|uniref:Dabb family protein n=1 Tax=Streptomyces sp. CT34 TaxID=1553907 RepID=UPI0005BB79CA|nr:Dabb family protein [Streptomyces sp. CT34]
MLNHVVLFKFRPGVTWDDPRALQAERASRRHPVHIPEILSWECGRNTTDRDIGYDFAVIGRFSDHQAVESYLSHPDHVQGVELWREIATWAVVDFPADAA